MTDTAHVAGSGPRTTELVQSTLEQAERSVLLWQDIECHLKDAEAKIKELRSAIRAFKLE